MLIKVTNYCSMGCSHCMENSTVKGEHMDPATFSDALAFVARIEALAWSMGCPPLVLLSGGECTEHPLIDKLIDFALMHGFEVALITNGMWLADDELREKILRPDRTKMTVQVTNDPRFYPKAPPRIDDPRIVYIDAITALFPMGRAATGKRHLAQYGLPKNKGPTSFNVRSLTRTYKSIERAIAGVRMRAWTGWSGHCSPSISANGDVVAGESNECFKIGTIHSTAAELTRAVINMRCNKCGLVDNLDQMQKRAIGESSLFAHDE